MHRKLLLGLLFGLGWRLISEYQQRMKRIPVTNKVVIITGASDGIGRAAAIRFAAQGAHVVLVARRAQRLAELQDTIAGFHGDTLAIAADITRSSEIESVVAETLARFGRIDVLVNNAGLDLAGYLEDHSPEQIQKTIETNLYGTIVMTRAVLPAMRSQHYGHIVNVSSVAGATLPAGYASYAATKAGMDGFSTALRRELRSSGIYVSIVRPSWTRTAMLATMDEAEMRQAGLVGPLLKLENAEDAAQSILDAVEGRAKEILRGGLGFAAGALLQRLYPPLLDWIYANAYDEAEMMRALRRVGRVQPPASGD